MEEDTMPRYLVERSFRGGFGIAATADGADACRALVEQNLDASVTWLHSYVSEDDRTCYCLYEAPSPEAIRRAAARSGLPVDRILRIRVLDPYFQA
jgi:cell division inhibitor SulA